MPIKLQISPINRLVVIVARGHVTPDEIKRNTEDLIRADVTQYGKIIDVSGATSDLSADQVERIAKMLRDNSDGVERGPVAFVINPEREGFAHAFAQVTGEDRPVRLFRSLQDARTWLGEIMNR